MKLLRLAGTLAVLGCAQGAAASDPRADLGLVLDAARYGELEDTAFGIAASFTFRLTSGLALDAQLGFSPEDLGEPAVSASRSFGFLGLRAGPRVDSVRLFAVVRPGFVRFAEAPEPFACILIYPPPLACSLAGGDTLFGLQLGGGLEATPGERWVVRLEAGSLLLEYPGPAITKDREAFQDSLWSHNFRASVSLGFRF